MLLWTVDSSILPKVSHRPSPPDQPSSRHSIIIIYPYYLPILPPIVQHECIPQAVLGMDIICQAKSGMGKTAVFVLATLHQLTPVEGQVHVVVLCHTRELAFQIQKEYERFSKYLPEVRSKVFYGGVLRAVYYSIFTCV